MSKERKPKMTRQRQVILDELCHTRTHPTADQLFERVRKRLPRIGLATVYRNLDSMDKAGLIRRLDDGAQRRYDADLSRHYHVRCLHCGSIDDIFDLEFCSPSDALRSANDFEIVDYHLEFLGICPKCR